MLVLLYKVILMFGETLSRVSPLFSISVIIFYNDNNVISINFYLRFHNNEIKHQLQLCT